jgi:type VI secretion system protein ImpJ
MVEILATKSDTLSAIWRERGKGLADFTASETINFLLLQTANTFLPELKHILRHAHPEQAYLVLSRLAGALATFAPDLKLSPNDLPDYEHNDLSSSFTVLDEQIRRLIIIVHKEAFIAVQFVRGDRDVWTAQVPDDRYFRNAEFYLAVSAAMDAGDIIQKVPARAKAGPPDEIERIMGKALNGLSLTHTSAPPAVRMRLGNQYFAVGQVGDLWQKVKQSRSLSVFAPDIKDPKLELIIVTQEGR